MQQFTATKIEAGELEEGLYAVYLSDLDTNAEEHPYLGFQRTLPDAEDEAESFDAEGFYVEYNGQENGCYQRARKKAKVRLIELTERTLRVVFTPASNFHQGEVDAIGNIPLSELVIHFTFSSETISSLREALQLVVGRDCEFLYSNGA